MNRQIRIFQSDTHRARAILNEYRASQEPDASIKREWAELAIEWHLLATTTANDEMSRVSWLPHRSSSGLPQT
jgi:hypothetical protein